MSTRARAAAWLSVASIGGGALLLQGCEVALLGAATASGVVAFEDRRSPGTQVDDEAIELRISSRIAERYGDKVHVNVNAYNRFALLTGEALDQGIRADVEKIALAVPNVRGVSNEIEISPPTAMSSRASDSFITSKVKARLIEERRRVSPVHVKVATEAGVVYLMGVVTQEEGDAAVQVARTTGGVRKVVKIFEYCKPEDEVCRPRPARPAEPAKPAA